MAKLKIENFGPITNVEFELKKFNVFIGQQGTGKSCILKIAAFCKWLEKVSSTSEVFDYMRKDTSDKDIIKKNLLDFYKLNDFVQEESKISYFSEFVELCVDFKYDDAKIMVKQFSSTLFRRVAYIPAERCLASAIPNLMSLRISQNTNIYKYLVDWEDAHKTYSVDKKMVVFKTHTSFYYDENLNADFLSVQKSDGEKNIRFENAASGFQSVIPICVLVNYYLKRDISLSIGEKRRIEKLTELSKLGINTPKVQELLAELYEKESEKLQNKGKDLSIFLLLSDMISLFSQDINANKNLHCSLFIEEPEANIFPETQYELVKWLVSTVNNGNENSIFIATHSPYILSSFNNLIQAENSVLSSSEKRSEINDIMQTEDFVNFDEIGVYEVKDGCINDIKDYDLHIINSNGIDSVSDIIQEQFSKLLDYEND